jgi:transcriptional regulator with XRE-family HTH domain
MAKIDDLNPVRYLRKKAGLSQRLLAKRLGVTELYIRRIEKGLVSHTDETLTLIWAELRRGLVFKGLDFYVLLRLDYGMELVGYALDQKYDELLPHESVGQSGTNSYWDGWVLLKRWTYRIKTKEKVTPVTVGGPVAFRKYACRVLGLPSNTLYALCEALCLHPFSIEQFEKTYTGVSTPAVRWPQEYADALSQVGIDTKGVNFLVYESA